MKKAILPALLLLLLASCSINIYTNDQDAQIGIINYQNFQLNQPIDSNLENTYFKSFTSYQNLTKVISYAKTSYNDTPKLSGQTVFIIALPKKQSFVIDEAFVRRGNTIIIKIKSTKNTTNPSIAVISTPKVKNAQNAQLYLDDSMIASTEIKY